MSLIALGQRLRTTAWVVVVFIVLAQIARLPSVVEATTRWQSTALGSAVGTGILALWVGAALLHWFIALRYAWRRHKELGASSVPLVVLVVTNFVGSVVYALFFSRRHAPRDALSE